MARSTSLSRTIDYLGDLGAKLRDLQGYRTLAHELIQNADDAPASWMSFDIRQDALVLDNDGFSLAVKTSRALNVLGEMLAMVLTGVTSIASA